MPDLNPLSLLDSLFLWGERPTTMMHVAGLLQFTPPPNAGPTCLRDIVEQAKADGVVHAPWDRKLRRPGVLRSPLQGWVVDRDIDLDYHVRRDALPSPGSERELGILVSRLHSTQLDFSRPPWELHFIEGLSAGRFAMYMKFHHALIDGYSAMRILARSFSTSAEDRELPLFFAVPPAERHRSPDAARVHGAGSRVDAEPESRSSSGPPSGSALDPGSISDSDVAESETDATGLLTDAGRFIDAARTQASSAVTLGKRITGPLLRRSSPDLTPGLQAPHSILNNRIGQSRRFATQQYAMPQLKGIAERYDATLNDVFLAIVGGGLRTFLTEMDALPERSLVAFLPVNVRPSDDSGGGNAIGAILTTIGSDIADPAERLHKVTASTTAAKAQLEGMTREAIMAYSAYLFAPAGLQAASAITGLRGLLPVNFNLCVSNVPGPRETLYLKGSRLDASYPVSIPFHSMALNVTLQSYVDTLGVGFVGCRDTLPHLQHLAVYTGRALEELAAA